MIKNNLFIVVNFQLNLGVKFFYYNSAYYFCKVLENTSIKNQFQNITHINNLMKKISAE
jgi:hypothetical protein